MRKFPRPTAPSPLPRVPAGIPAVLLSGVLVLLTLPTLAGAQERGAAFDPALYQDLDWRFVGPARGGRVTAVAGHRDHPLTFYMGSTGGGVWKTENYGRTWRNMSDGAGFNTASIGAIQVADSDPGTIYVGTGSDGIRSNVITGRGMYRTTDAGESWTFLGLREAGQIGAVEIHPTDPDLVYAAALGHPFGTNDTRGVFRSRDGGESWEKVLFVSDSVGVIDLEMKPDDPDVVYAAAWRGERKPWTIISGCAPGCGDGIWKSSDGGDSWKQVKEGLPRGPTGKVDLAVSGDDPDRVYALVEAEDGEEGLYRSDDSGESWRLVNDRRGLMARPFYYTNVTADPTNADVVYVNNEEFYRSTDAGKNFEAVDTPHGDNHDMWINPDPALAAEGTGPASGYARVFIQSNDGGANVTLDGGETWSTQRNQPTAELYQVDVDDRFPYWLSAGQQDNSTIQVPSRPPAESAPAGPEGWWKAVGGCETGPAVPKPGEPSTVFANCKGRFGRYDKQTGQEQNYWVGGEYIYGHDPADLQYRFQRTVPIEISPHDPDVVYHGSQHVHRTTNGGQRWETISPDLTANPPEYQMRPGGPITYDITGEEYFSTTYTIQVSPHRKGVIWVGTNDGLVQVTRDGGESWSEVTPDGLPAHGRINAIEPSPHERGTAYVAAYRYLLDDWEPYVFRTTDYGRTWTRLTDGTNGIPADYPVRVVREDPQRPGLLYAGTEFGIFVSFDDGEHWQPLQLDLPVTPVTDIAVTHQDLAISTMGRGFWILDNLTPLHQLADSVANADAHLFAPRDAHRMRYRASPGYGGREPHEPEYPRPGAAIDYYLSEAPPGEVTLEILDEDGRLVRGYSSAEGGYEFEQVQGMREPRTLRLGGPRLEKSAGMHRVTWNFRHPGAAVPEGVPKKLFSSTGDAHKGAYGRAATYGPMAAPGEYRVRLTVGGRTYTRKLRVLIDPRVKENGVTVSDLQEQERLNLKIRNSILGARQLAARVHRVRDSVRRALQAGRGDTAVLRSVGQDVAALMDSLVTDPDVTYPEPMLIDQMEYLYGMTTSADQALGEAAFMRHAALRDKLSRYAARADSLEEQVAEASASAP